ncbi:hypothetical protein C1646_757247 [Rhizophagus diaphanus]|nr:hypothetical protein C1646_757247 [Rhizophagus diaphanus] [Rhizophagus sp. MUCL 43196]
MKRSYYCRAILIDILLYNGLKESYENQISFLTFNYSAMEIKLIQNFRIGSAKLQGTSRNYPNNIIEFNRLSIAAFQYLLFCTHEKEIQFATPEYEVFQYCAIFAVKQVFNDAYESLKERLPALEQIEFSP